MWGVISKMGEELRELTNRENSSESEDEEQVDAPKDSDTGVPPNTTGPLPFMGQSSAAPAVSFGTFDAASVRDSVSSAVPRQPSPKQQDEKPREDLFAGKADVAAKGKDILDSINTTPSPHVNFTATISPREDVSLVGGPPNVATTSARGSTPLAIAGDQIKIEAPPRYSGKRQPGFHVWLT